MPVFLGFSERITNSSQKDTLVKACPECSADLELKDLKKWWYIFFIPSFPIKTIESFYHCTNCESSYKYAAREALISAGKNKEHMINEAKKLYATTLAACMMHMAKIDGNIAIAEEEEIKKITQKYPDHQSDMLAMIEKIKHIENPEEEVYALLKKCASTLTSDALLNIMAQSANILKADGKIETAEYQLLKKYLNVCGLPASSYEVIIERMTRN
jgi:uncharacterized tellurite resistance protein B-like protein